MIFHENRLPADDSHSGLDKDLVQWVFNPLLFNLMSIFTPYLKYQIAENAKPCKKDPIFA